jgi:hypothetical protein
MVAQTRLARGYKTGEPRFVCMQPLQQYRLYSMLELFEAINNATEAAKGSRVIRLAMKLNSRDNAMINFEMGTFLLLLEEFSTISTDHNAEAA